MSPSEQVVPASFPVKPRTHAAQEETAVRHHVAQIIPLGMRSGISPEKFHEIRAIELPELYNLPHKTVVWGVKYGVYGFDLWANGKEARAQIKLLKSLGIDDILYASHMGERYHYTKNRFLAQAVVYFCKISVEVRHPYHEYEMETPEWTSQPPTPLLRISGGKFTR
jgi:hypothetical protein